MSEEEFEKFLEDAAEESRKSRARIKKISKQFDQHMISLLRGLQWFWTIQRPNPVSAATSQSWVTLLPTQGVEG